MEDSQYFWGHGGAGLGLDNFTNAIANFVQKCAIDLIEDAISSACQMTSG